MAVLEKSLEALARGRTGKRQTWIIMRVAIHGCIAFRDCLVV